MAAMAISAPLNAEPANPAEREEMHLPPKSYVDAVEQEPNQNDSTPAIDPDSVDPKQNGNSEQQTPAKAPLLRVISTGSSDGVSPFSKASTTNGGHKGNHVYDDVPQSPTYVPKRKSSLASSIKSDDAPSTNGKTVNFSSYGHGGANDPDSLLSVKPDASYEKRRERKPSRHTIETGPLIEEHDEEELAEEVRDQLVSGRQALGGWDISGIRFAPWNVPLRRRLQTLMVMLHTLSIAGSVSIFFFLCGVPLLWPLLIPYLVYCLLSEQSTCGSLSRRSEFMRRLPIWSLYASYFPARLHRSEELPPTRKYIFGYHPHGIISHGAFAAFGTEALGFAQLFPGITNTVLTLDSNFRLPVYRDYALSLGLASVSRESCYNLLSKGGTNGEGMGRAITIVVGGARESLDAQPFSLRLVLRRRKGFVKMALRTGADLVPVLAFGENELYDQVTAKSHPRIHRFQLIIKKFFGFTVPLVHARGVFNYDFGLMPYRRPMNIVVGRVVRVRQSAKPTQEEIDGLHGQYVDELERLWHTWKEDFAPERREEMRIIE